MPNCIIVSDTKIYVLTDKIKIKFQASYLQTIIIEDQADHFYQK